MESDSKLSLSFDEIVQVLEDNDVSFVEFIDCDFDSEELGLGEVELVYQIKDIIGDCYNVIHFIDHDIYVRINFEVDSYNIHGYDSIDGYGYQVFPKEVKRLEYLKIDEDGE